jgi:hypothetical protein
MNDKEQSNEEPRTLEEFWEREEKRQSDKAKEEVQGMYINEASTIALKDIECAKWPVIHWESKAGDAFTIEGYNSTFKVALDFSIEYEEDGSAVLVYNDGTRIVIPGEHYKLLCSKIENDYEQSLTFDDENLVLKASKPGGTIKLINTETSAFMTLATDKGDTFRVEGAELAPEEYKQPSKEEVEKAQNFAMRSVSNMLNQELGKLPDIKIRKPVKYTSDRDGRSTFISSRTGNIVRMPTKELQDKNFEIGEEATWDSEYNENRIWVTKCVDINEHGQYVMESDWRDKYVYYAGKKLAENVDDSILREMCKEDCKRWEQDHITGQWRITNTHKNNDVTDTEKPKVTFEDGTPFEIHEGSRYHDYPREFGPNEDYDFIYNVDGLYYRIVQSDGEGGLVVSRETV